MSDIIINHQDRLMHTYEVRVTSPNASAVELVNLSYQLNDDLEPVNGSGARVTPMSVAARIEVLKRLRKLAEREATPVSLDLIDEGDWDMRLVRSAFVKVPVDQAGIPIPHRREG